MPSGTPPPSQQAAGMVYVAQVDNQMTAGDSVILYGGTEMYRLVWSVGNQSPLGIKNRAGKIKTFLDVGGYRRPLQDTSHLFGD